MKVNVQEATRRAWRQEFDKEITDAVIERIDITSDMVDTSILWALHKEFGFGHDRLIRFYHAWHKEHMAMIERFRAFDDWETESQGDLEIMHKRLEEIGIDLKELYAEQQIADEDYQVWKQKKIDERLEMRKNQKR